MPNKKISQLNINISPTISDIIPIVNSGETKQISLSGLTEFIGDNLTIGDLSGTSITTPMDGQGLVYFNGVVTNQNVINYDKRLVSGGAVWAGTGLTYNVSILQYYFNAPLTATSATTVVLSSGDTSFDRIDAVVIDESGNVLVIEGDPAPSPITPDISDYILVQYIIVSMGITQPVVTEENIYLDNDGWSTSTGGSQVGGSIDFDSNDSPQQGNKCIKLSGITTAGKYAFFIDSTPVSFSQFQTFQIYVKLTSAIRTSSAFNISVYNTSGTLIGSVVNLFNVGLNRNLTGVWQLVTFATSLFNTGTIPVGRMAIRIAGGTPTITIPIYYLDNIKMIGNIIPPPIVIPNNGITIQHSGNSIGQTSNINFIPSGNTSLNITNDTINNRINITINSVGSNTDIYVTGGTYNNGSAVFSNNTGGTFTVTGFSSGDTSYWSASTGTNAIVVKNSNNIASGTLAIAEGQGTIASGITSHAEGFGSEAGGNYSHAEGFFTKALGQSSHAEGSGTTANGLYSHSEGFFTTANGDATHSEGYNTTALGFISHAEGEGTTASGNASHAEGNDTTSVGFGSHAEGQSTVTIGNYSHSEGYQTTANGEANHTEGYQTTSNGLGSHAEGYLTTANGLVSHAEGERTIANGYTSHAEGSGTTANGIASHSEGFTSTANANYSHAEGFQTTASGFNSHAEGGITIASGDYGSHAEGHITTASGPVSHAEGQETIASGPYCSHAEGYQTTSSAAASHSEGYLTTASGANSHAEGQGSIAISDSSHAEGFFSIANGIASHAEGRTTQANGDFSHTEGLFTYADNDASHAEGRETTAIGLNSHAEGYRTTASGSYSHAEGWFTTANGGFSHAGGYLSIASGNTSFVHGSGSTAGGTGTVVLGNGITGLVDNTTYVPNLNISIISSGISITNLGIDANGFVISGNTSGDIPSLSAVTAVGNITSDDIEISDSNKGIILRSPDNTRWRITVDNSGSIITTIVV